MAYLRYDGFRIDITPNALAYIQAVVHNVLRADVDAAFTVMINGALDDGTESSTSLWISRATHIIFDYGGSPKQTVRAEVLDSLLKDARDEGLVIIGEGRAPYEIVDDAD